MQPNPPRRGPVAGRVVDIEPIEGADAVRLARVDIGTGEMLKIVFGGVPVVHPGDVVPVAPPGSWVPGPAYDRVHPVKMRRRRYRGERSAGMLCSLRELGWAKGSADRVAVLRPDLPIGEPLPERGGWRHVVESPAPEEFGENTVEMDLADLKAAWMTFLRERAHAASVTAPPT